MATQRITIAKVGGAATDVVLQRLRGWAAARNAADPSEWSSDQWPASVRAQVDAFAERLRAHSVSLPVIYFVEWSDQWSMGDLFDRWLTPLNQSSALAIHADRFELYGYELPDGDRLNGRLAMAGPQQFAESAHFVSRLREAIEAWQCLAERAVLIVLREVVGGMVTDNDFEASMLTVPDWLRGDEAD